MFKHSLFCRPAVDERTAADLAEFFGALSDASRVRIVATLLDGERHVGAIAEAIGMSESAVSHQLRGLRQLRLVRARKVGREVHYALDDDHVRQLVHLGLQHIQHRG
jgi:DNA-binding transcriptional ArsR family regulator